MAKAKWNFWALDNSGKQQHFTVSADSKFEAIRKGNERARKNAAGDITRTECKLILSSL